MIDTKALRSLDTDSNLGLSIPMSHEAICAIADELDRLYHDTSPLSREELETVLKENAKTTRIPEDGPIEFASKSGVVFCLSDDGKEVSIIDAPLASVTRRLLRDCGVIE